MSCDFSGVNRTAVPKMLTEGAVNDHRSRAHDFSHEITEAMHVSRTDWRLLCGLRPGFATTLRRALYDRLTGGAR